MSELNQLQSAQSFVVAEPKEIRNGFNGPKRCPKPFARNKQKCLGNCAKCHQSDKISYVTLLEVVARTRKLWLNQTKEDILKALKH